MIKTIIKRDDTRVDYNPAKIEKALKAALKASKEDITEENFKKLFEWILKQLPQKDEVTVEEVSDIVENGLMNKNYYAAARASVLYREERNKARLIKMKHMQEIKEKLDASKVANQNANVDEYSFGGRKGEADSVQMKMMALDYYMNPKFAKNHNLNRVYIHDLDAYVVGMHNCLSIPFDKLLKEGFGTRQTDIRPVNSVGTAFQILAVLFQVQSLQQFGGVSATHLDWTMVPYVRKSFYKHYKTGLKYIDEMSDEGIEEYLKALCITDKEPPIASPLYQKNAKVYKYAMDMTKKELKQAVEGMYHNLNTLQSRSGNQLPFSSINYGTCTLLEGQMVTEALLKGSIAGVGKYNKTSIFPCGIFQYKKGVNDKPGTPNYYLYRLALESTARRLYPNYANVDWKNDGDTTDYDVKQAFLSSLDPTQQRTLYNACVSHPEYCEQYGFDIDEASKSVKPKTFIPEAMFSTMGCRTNNGFDINWYEVWKDEVETIANGYKVLEPAAMPSGHVRDGRGNIAPATIILPTLAMESKKKAEKAGHPEYVVEYFFDALDKALTDCRDELIERFNWIAAQDPRSAKFMYENHTMAGYRPSEGIRSALKHGTLAVGQIGMAECLQILVGCNHLDPRGMELAKKIEQLYKDRCAEWKEEWRYVEPGKEEVCNLMVANISKKEGRQLSTAELKQIKDFVVAKYAR